MRIELLFFSPNDLVIEATKLLFHKQKESMCVRDWVAMEFLRVDMGTFLEWYGADGMLSVINGPPFFDEGNWAAYARNIPSLTERCAAVCERLGLKTWEGHPHLPDGFTISVPTGLPRCPVLLLYGRESSREGWSSFDGLSSALRLIEGDCRIGVPCEGSVFGAVPAAESVSEMVRALEAHAK